MNKIEVNLLFSVGALKKKNKTINHFEVKLLNYGIETIYLCIFLRDRVYNLCFRIYGEQFTGY